MSQPVIRDARDDDAEGLFALLEGVFAEYPGCLMERDEMPELCAVATSFRAAGGHFWVADLASDEGRRVAASIGWTPAKDPSGVELKKLYVDRSARRMGLGGRLCELVESAARARAAAFVDLWSDTRFADAHRLYERRGYRRGPQTRELHDVSSSVEYYYRLDF